MHYEFFHIPARDLQCVTPTVALLFKRREELQCIVVTMKRVALEVTFKGLYFKRIKNYTFSGYYNHNK